MVRFEQKLWRGAEIVDYEKKIADQQKEINRLKEQLEGIGQVDKIADALILSMLVAVGADQEHPVTVDKAKVNELLSSGNVRLAIDATSDGYSMHYSVNE